MMSSIKDLFEWVFSYFKFWVIIQPWELGIKVRLGKSITKLNPGLHFKLPYIDSVYKQEVRLRVLNMSIQTLTTKDLKTVTVDSSLGYSIDNIELLYNSLYHPEVTLSNMAMSEIADFIFLNNLEDITPRSIESAVMEKLNANNYGLKFEYFRLTNFAVVRTYRLIQDQSWTNNGLYMDEKHC